METKLLDTRKAADFLGLKPNTLKLYRTIGRGPRYVQELPRRVKYRKADLIAYQQQREQR